MELFVIAAMLTSGAVLQVSRADNYYVKTGNSTCDGITKCHTLQEYATDEHGYFGSDDSIILLFHEGIHKSNATLNISNVASLSLLDSGNNNSRCSVSIIGDFLMENITKLLHFKSICITGQVEATSDTVTIEQSNFYGGPNVSIHAQVVTIKDANFHGSNSEQKFNMRLNLTCYNCKSIDIHDLALDDAFMDISILKCDLENSRCRLNVTSLKATQNVSEVINTTQTEPPKSLVNIMVQDTNVMLEDCSVSGSDQTGLRSELTRSSITMTRCSLTHNKMGGAYIIAKSNNIQVVIQDTVVAENSLRDIQSGNPYRWFVVNGAGLAINTESKISTSQETYHLLMDNVTFERNHDNNDVPKTVFVYNSHNTTISNCVFTQNNGSAVAVYLTTLFTVRGETEFTHNRGYEGGALLMFNTHLTIPDGSRLTLENNRVENVGGAICVRNIPIQIDSGQPCFYQLDSTFESPNITVLLEDNRAQKGGDNIYGGTTNTSCTALKNPSNESRYGKPCNEIFSYHGKSNSSVTSEPTRVCLCSDYVKKCADAEFIFVEKSLYPGEMFVLQGVVVGADFGAVSGSVVAETDGNSLLSALQSAQSVDSTSCRDLKYTIHSEPDRTAEITLSIDGSTPNNWYRHKDTTYRYINEYNESGEIDINLLSTPIFIEVKMKSCPTGFTFDPSDKICNCDTQITRNSNITCFFRDGLQLANRSGKSWISLDNASSSLRFSSNCLPHKCNQSFLTLNLETPNAQCIDDRNGVLCGRCGEGDSLYLGSLKCGHCETNLYLLLILPFALLGILLVSLIKVLDLTVADGYINGFIFYSNIIWASKNQFMPQDVQGLEFLHAFLAWFNLDFGIQSCFFVGMDAYVYTWLQFVFPLYILLISIIIIVVAQRVNILGNNAIPVLATLLLLSHYKFLVIIVSVFEFSSILHFTNGSNDMSIAVWRLDENIEYFSGIRIPLVLVAALVFVLFCVPYTLTLLFSRQFNRMRSTSRMLKLKAVFDAYGGPFKSWKEYWVGVLLILRAVLLIPSTVANGEHSFYYDITLIIVLTGLLFFQTLSGRLYKTKKLALTENSLILNLIILTSLAFLPEDADMVRSYLAYSLVGLAFFQFLALVSVKIVLLFRKIYYHEKSSSATDKNLRHSDYVVIEEDSRRPAVSMTTDSGWFESGRHVRMPELSYSEHRS